jgi:oligopeptide/dipeptide ABC transporter ATP-binding protein
MYAGKIIESGTAHDIYHHPHHPYTLALLRSVPRMDQPRRGRLDPVQGQPPDLSRLGAGCSFQPRCGFAVARCASQSPPLEPVDGGDHLAACFEADNVAGSMTRSS